MTLVDESKGSREICKEIIFSISLILCSIQDNVLSTVCDNPSNYAPFKVPIKFMLLFSSIFPIILGNHVVSPCHKVVLPTHGIPHVRDC